MELINYILLSFVTYLGLFCGMILVFIAPEEQKPGRRYFGLVQNICISIIAGTLVFYFSFLNLIMAILLIGLVFVKRDNMYFTYVMFAPVLFFSSQINSQTLLISAMIFVYGLATGSLFSNVKKKY